MALAACGAGEEPLTPVARARPPDIVLIVIDTLRADAVFDRPGKYATPHLDRLASDGLAFERAFAAAPMTLPSHVSLFSARPVHRTGVTNNGQDIPEDLPLLAEWLAAHGYDTRAVVSLGTLSTGTGNLAPSRGFASYDRDFFQMAAAAASFERLAASLAERDCERPLFLFAHFADPHEPYESHGTERHEVEVRVNGAALVRLQSADFEQWRGTLELPPGRSQFELVSEHGKPIVVRQFECLEDGRALPLQWEQGQRLRPSRGVRLAVERGVGTSARCELRLWVNDVPRLPALRARYALEVTEADRCVGLLFAELERLGLYQESLIVFTSDHGEGLERELVGHVENLSDALIRVPLILKPPRSHPRGEELASAAGRLVSHIDLVPTVLELAGLPPLPGQEGASLFATSPGVHLAETHRPEAQHDQLALRDGQFKMVYFPLEERFELYDLAQDPREEHDVFQERAGERPDWPARLRRVQEERRAPSLPLDEAERAERAALLEALGYAGGDD